MIRMEDRLHSHKFFITAVCGLLRVYLKLHAQRQVERAAAAEEAKAKAAAEEAMTPQERRAAKKKEAFQEKKRKAKEEAEVNTHERALSKPRSSDD